jgi:hypothetical protein
VLRPEVQLHLGDVESVSGAATVRAGGLCSVAEAFARAAK